MDGGNCVSAHSHEHTGEKKYMGHARGALHKVDKLYDATPGQHCSSSITSTYTLLYYASHDNMQRESVSERLTYA